MKNRFFIFALIFIFVFPNCTKKTEDTAINENKIIARVGKRTITVRDFKLSYEMSLHIPSGKSGFEAKKLQLDHVIQRKLFAAEAERQGLNNEPQLQKYLNYYKRKAAIKELYRQKIAAQVKVSEDELRNAFQEANTKIRARHLYAKTAGQAEKLRRRLQHGESFAGLAREIFRDSTLAHNGGDVGYFTRGEMDENFEKAAFSLPVGEISQPVHSRYGWHIIQVTDIRRNILLTESDYAAEKPKLKKEITNRKSRQLAREYVKRIMTPHQVVLKKKAFAVVTTEFDKIFGQSANLYPSFLPNMYTRELKQVSSGLQDHLNDILLTFTNGYWTVGDFITKLQDIPVTDRPVYQNAAKLRNDIGILYRNEVLAGIALADKLEETKEAKQEWKNRWDDVLYSRMISQLLDTVRVTDAEVQNYYQQHQSEFTDPPKVNIREIFVSAKDLAEKLKRKIAAGQDMAELAKKYSLRKWAAKNGGEFGYFDLGKHGQLGKLAFNEPVGAIVGPIATTAGIDRNGYSIFRVLGKREAQKIPFTAVEKKLRHKILNRKREKAISDFTNRLKGKQVVESHPDLLNKLKTIDDLGEVPLITFPITNF